MGLATIAGLPSGAFGSLSGTSFSAPLVSGLVAGVIQANPTKTAQEIIQVIRKSGSQSSQPDNLLGYGIPHFERVNQLLNPVLGSELPTKNRFEVYPNPAFIGQKIHIATNEFQSGTLEIFNTQGAIVQTMSFKQSEFDFFPAPFVSGKYYFRFTSENQMHVIPVLLNL
jgi:subtilisin family serine protease